MGKIVWENMEKRTATDRKRRTLRPLRILSLFSILFFFVSNSAFPLMIKLPLSRLSSDADTIVLGEVVSLESYWSMDRSTIVTIVMLDVQRVIKGELSSRQVLIQFPGGEIGDIGLKVSDQPGFDLHEKALVFLESITEKNDPQNPLLIAMSFWPSYTVVGAAQGKYSIDEGGIARKGGYSLVSDEPDPDRSLPLEHLITRIHRSIKHPVSVKAKTREKK